MKVQIWGHLGIWGQFFDLGTLWGFGDNYEAWWKVYTRPTSASDFFLHFLNMVCFWIFFGQRTADSFLERHLPFS
jgi:hypothetical protein